MEKQIIERNASMDSEETFRVIIIKVGISDRLLSQ